MLRIDEMEKRGISKIHKVEDGGGNVARMPSPVYIPTKTGDR